MIHHWFHRWVRKSTRPINEQTAMIWKRRLSIAYGLLAWNALGFIMYNVYLGKADWAHYHGLKSDEEKDMPPGLSWANTLGIKNATVFRISGIKKVDEYEIVDGKQCRKAENKENDESLEDK